MEKIKTLSLDLETYSSVSLKKSGVYPYAESPDFEILLFGYSVNGGPVQVVDIACGEQIPEPVLAALTDDTIIKWAFNASFERICLSYWLLNHYPEHFKSYSIFVLPTKECANSFGGNVAKGTSCGVSLLRSGSKEPSI